MKKRKRVLGGPKFNGRHSTYTPVAQKFILAARGLPEVTKIILGPIRRAGGGGERLSYRRVRAGLCVTARGGMSVQTLYVYTPTPEATEAAIERITRGR